MNWFKQSQQHPIELSDRNIINDRIRFFEDVSVSLEKLSKVVFQDARFAKNELVKMSSDKKISSYPKVKDMLVNASVTALDNPWKFSALCWDIIDEVGKKISEAKRIRKELIEETLPNKMKGWVDRHGR